MGASTESSPVRIAIVDDDTGLLTVIDRRLDLLRWEREVLNYAPGPDHLAAMRLHGLVLNPALTGLDYLERVGQALPGLAILVVSEPVSVAERVRALRAGADDWITKPCHPEELVARIQAVLRRRRIGDTPVDDAPVVAGELTIRPDRYDAYVGYQPAGLSRKEYELLRLLATGDGRVLEREQIYQRVWGYTMARGDRSVDVFVRKLRNKLERISPAWSYIHTHFGVGYRFAAQRLDGSDLAGAGAPLGGPTAAPRSDPTAAPLGGPTAAPLGGPSAAPLGSAAAAPTELAPGGCEAAPTELRLGLVRAR